MLFCHILVLSMVAGATAHGRLTLPVSRQGGSLDVAGTNCGWHDGNSTAACECCWYTDKIEIPGEPTICDPDLVTAEVKPCSPQHNTDWTRKRPWRAPGTAPILSPCGRMNSGEQDGINLPQTNRTLWRQGDTVEVAEAVTANHGGGYAYRLCPASEKLTEACFQAHHLKFADDITTVRFVDGSTLTIPAHRTTNGTTPPGSQWTKNPIPNNPKFWDPPFPGASGGKWNFSLIDRVVLPSTLAPGDYVLSWRWDCEITPQVWSNCGDVTITGKIPSPTMSVLV